MRIRLVIVTVAVAIFPVVGFAQLAPQSQAAFEQRFTGWSIQYDAPDCNNGEGIDPTIFTGPGRAETSGIGLDYEYLATGSNSGTLTVTDDFIGITQVADLTFDSRTTGAFVASVFGVSLCDGSFAFVDSTTAPPLLVRAAVDESGQTIALDFDKGIDTDSLSVELLRDTVSISADGEPVQFQSYWTLPATIGLWELSTVITRGQTVVVTYTDPTPGDDEHAIQDSSGNDAASFTETPINNSTVAPVPALPLVGVGLLGLLLACLGNWLRQSGRGARWGRGG